MTPEELKAITDTYRISSSGHSRVVNELLAHIATLERHSLALRSDMMYISTAAVGNLKNFAAMSVRQFDDYTRAANTPEQQEKT